MRLGTMYMTLCRSSPHTTLSHPFLLPPTSLPLPYFLVPPGNGGKDADHCGVITCPSLVTIGGIPAPPPSTGPTTPASSSASTISTPPAVMAGGGSGDIWHAGRKVADATSLATQVRGQRTEEVEPLLVEQEWVACPYPVTRARGRIASTRNW